jgi:hypothetical protein
MDQAFKMGNGRKITFVSTKSTPKEEKVERTRGEKFLRVVGWPTFQIMERSGVEKKKVMWTCGAMLALDVILSSRELKRLYHSLRHQMAVEAFASSLKKG